MLDLIAKNGGFDGLLNGDDEITQKDFWRGHLQQGGARVPMELARWEGDADGACAWAAGAGAAAAAQHIPSTQMRTGRLINLRVASLLEVLLLGHAKWA